MPCDTRLKKGQTIKQRAAEVSRVVERLAAGLAAGRIKPKISAEGGVAFDGLGEAERDGVTDACAYRRLMASSNTLAKHMMERAELMSGRKVDRHALAQGVHSHDGGKTWHHHKG